MTLDGAVAGVFRRLLGVVDRLDLVTLHLAAGLFTGLESSVLIGLLVPGDTVVLLLGTTLTGPVGFVTGS
jgi:membrane-associated protein